MILCIVIEFFASMTLVFIFKRIGQVEVEVKYCDTRQTEMSNDDVGARITLGRVTIKDNTARQMLMDTLIEEEGENDDYSYEVNGPCIFPTEDERAIAMSKILTSFCKPRVMTAREIRSTYVDLGGESVLKHLASAS